MTPWLVAFSCVVFGVLAAVGAYSLWKTAQEMKKWPS